MRILGRYFFLSAALMLAACSSAKLEKLKEANPAASDFNSALAAEYLAYADSEKEQGRRFDSEFFASKGLLALADKPVLPEPVKDKLNPADTRALTAGRESLVGVLTEDMKHVSPQKAARAQLLFDCWQQQLVTHVNQELAPCAGEFASTLTELQNQADDFVTGEETSHAVSFPPHTTVLSDAGRATVAEIAARVQKYKRYSLQLDGHVEEYARLPKTLALTHKRMEAVRDLFMKAGIAEDRITLLKEKPTSRPVVLSTDKQLPPRSVEINVQTYGAGGTH